MGDELRRCPSCHSTDLEEGHLSQKGSAWPILFGSTLFEKKELLAYACKECGFVFLVLGDLAAGEAAEAD